MPTSSTITSSNETPGVQIDMSSPISADDLALAGGLGAKDDLGHMLPVAMDATDFEEVLRGLEGASDANSSTNICSAQSGNNRTIA